MGLRGLCQLLSGEHPEVVNSSQVPVRRCTKMAFARWTQKASESANWMSFETRMIARACTPKQQPHSLEKTRKTRVVPRPEEDGPKHFTNGHADYVANLFR